MSSRIYPQACIAATIRQENKGFGLSYLPQTPGETPRRYLFVAIDRATCGVCMHICGDMTGQSSVDLLRRLKLARQSGSVRS